VALDQAVEHLAGEGSIGVGIFVEEKPAPSGFREMNPDCYPLQCSNLIFSKICMKTVSLGI